MKRRFGNFLIISNTTDARQISANYKEMRNVNFIDLDKHGIIPHSLAI